MDVINLILALIAASATLRTISIDISSSIKGYFQLSISDNTDILEFHIMNRSKYNVRIYGTFLTRTENKTVRIPIRQQLIRTGLKKDGSSCIRIERSEFIDMIMQFRDRLLWSDYPYIPIKLLLDTSEGKICSEWFVYDLRKDRIDRYAETGMPCFVMKRKITDTLLIYFAVLISTTVPMAEFIDQEASLQISLILYIPVLMIACVHSSNGLGPHWCIVSAVLSVSPILMVTIYAMTLESAITLLIALFLSYISLFSLSGNFRPKEIKWYGTMKYDPYDPDYIIEDPDMRISSDTISESTVSDQGMDE
ncbi:hypothetical protein PED39_03045 [Methanomassiliicoccales archaeon LGM-RCC1]|nr:hypothetical protein PED39_03045 [Methanomassiliicoccales archaeon LGM-RCC1]